MEYLQHADTTGSGRPVLRPNEKDVIIHDSVGLYDGTARISSMQEGRIILTDQRIIYIDKVNTRENSMFLDLELIKSIDYSPSFLKRSARLILFLTDDISKIINGIDNVTIENNVGISNNKVNNDDGNHDTTVTEWVCPICQYNNSTKGKFTIENCSEMICGNCGIPADFDMIKDSINYISRNLPNTESNNNGKRKDGVPCPTCTFMNHPSMKNCEMCNAPLPPTKKSKSSKGHKYKKKLIKRIDSTTNNYIQLSFRKSNGVLFAQATGKILEDLKKQNIFNQNAIQVNGIDINTSSVKEIENTTKTVQMDKMDYMGINGLERFREDQLLNNDIIFNSALQDLNKLMTMANSIERLYKNSNELTNEKKRQLGTEESRLLVDRDKFFSKDLFIDEIAREVYEFAMLEFKDNEVNNNVLIPLIDLYAMYNKAMRIGAGLISPEELKDACNRFTKLGLTDLKLLKLNDRVLCLASTHSFDYVQSKIINIIKEETVGCDVLMITQIMNSDSNSSTNTWTISIIEEILQTCISNGILVIDEQMSGITYYHNSFWGDF